MDPKWYNQYKLATQRHDADVAKAEQRASLKRTDGAGVVSTRPKRFYVWLGRLGVLLVEIGFRMQSRFSPQPFPINNYLVAERRSLETDHPC